MVKLRIALWMLLVSGMAPVNMHAQDLKILYTLPQNEYANGYLGMNVENNSKDILTHVDTSENRYLSVNKIKIISRDQMIISVNYKLNNGDRVQGIGIVSSNTGETKVLASTSSPYSYIVDFTVLGGDTLVYLVNEPTRTLVCRLSVDGGTDTVYKGNGFRIISNIHKQKQTNCTYYLADSSGNTYLLKYNWDIGMISQTKLDQGPIGLQACFIGYSDSNKLYVAVESASASASGLYSIRLSNDSTKFENSFLFQDIVGQGEKALNYFLQNSLDTIFILTNDLNSKSSHIYQVSENGVIRARHKVPSFYYFEAGKTNASIYNNILILNLFTDTIDYSGGLIKYTIIDGSFESLISLNDSIGDSGNCLSDIYSDSDGQVVSFSTFAGRTAGKGGLASYNLSSDSLRNTFDFISYPENTGHQFEEANFITFGKNPIYLSQFGGNQGKGSLHALDIASNQLVNLYNFGDGKTSLFDSHPKFPIPHSLRKIDDSNVLFICESSSFQSDMMSLTKLNLTNNSIVNLFTTSDPAEYIQDVSNIAENQALIVVSNILSSDNQLIILDVGSGMIQDTLDIDLSNLGTVRLKSNSILYNQHAYLLYHQESANRICLLEYNLLTKQFAISWFDERYIGSTFEFRNISITSTGILYFSNRTDYFEGLGTVVSFDVLNRLTRYHRLKSDVNLGAIPIGKIFISDFSDDLYFKCGAGFSDNLGGLMKFVPAIEEFTPVLSFGKANDYRFNLHGLNPEYKGGIWLSKMWPTSVNEKDEIVKAEISINCYPNPSKQQVNVSLLNAVSENISRYTVYDINGNKLIDQFLEVGVGEISIDITLFSQGVYLIQLITDGQSTFTTKFIKD